MAKRRMDISRTTVSLIAAKSTRARTAGGKYRTRAKKFKFFNSYASSEVHSVGLKPGRYEVGNLGLAYCAELADGLLNDPIRVRHALVLPEMLEPGR